MSVNERKTVVFTCSYVNWNFHFSRLRRPTHFVHYGFPHSSEMKTLFFTIKQWSYEIISSSKPGCNNWKPFSYSNSIFERTPVRCEKPVIYLIDIKTRYSWSVPSHKIWRHNNTRPAFNTKLNRRYIYAMPYKNVPNS